LPILLWFSVTTGFALAEERYNSYKPILDELEKMREEAEVDEKDAKTGLSKGSIGGGDISRNRR
jgi:hypothetical protein